MWVGNLQELSWINFPGVWIGYIRNCNAVVINTGKTFQDEYS